MPCVHLLPNHRVRYSRNLRGRKPAQLFMHWRLVWSALRCGTPRSLLKCELWRTRNLHQRSLQLHWRLFGHQLCNCPSSNLHRWHLESRRSQHRLWWCQLPCLPQLFLVLRKLDAMLCNMRGRNSNSSCDLLGPKWHCCCRLFLQCISHSGKLASL